MSNNMDKRKCKVITLAIRKELQHYCNSGCSITAEALQ